MKRKKNKRRGNKNIRQNNKNNQGKKILELNNRKKDILKKLDDLLLETFQTSDVIIDEQKLVNGEEGCLCNIDLQKLDDGSKQGLFDLDLIDHDSQQKIESRITQILSAIKNQE